MSDHEKNTIQKLAELYREMDAAAFLAAFNEKYGHLSAAGRSELLATILAEVDSFLSGNQAIAQAA